MTDTTPTGGPAPKNTSAKIKTDEGEAEDPIAQAVGEFGRWQLQLTFFLSLFNIPCTWHIFALTFQTLPSDFWCAKPPDLENLSVEEWRNISHTTYTKVETLDTEISVVLTKSCTFDLLRGSSVASTRSSHDSDVGNTGSRELKGTKLKRSVVA
jgi:OCT family organic cation transporter-like MFS transporter 4/5